MKLFRPTGLRELQLVLARDLAAWPPRLPEQPIFYPVLNETYAGQIAREWNAKSDEQVGYVTAFGIGDAYASRFERRVVGGQVHEELWVPAEELEEFNRHLIGPVRVIGAYFGDGFSGLVPTAGALRGLRAAEQLTTLAGVFNYSLQDFHGEVTMNRDAVFLHLPFWRKDTVQLDNVPVAKQDVLAAIERVWTSAFPQLPLPVEVS